jgi:hypothetical protein
VLYYRSNERSSKVHSDREGTAMEKVRVLVAGVSKMTDLGSGSAAKPERKSWDDLTHTTATPSITQ